VDFGDWPILELTGFQTWLKNYRMGQAERQTCPHCGAFLILAMPPGGKGQRTFQCFECDGLDPLKTATGWVEGRATAVEVSPLQLGLFHFQAQSGAFLFGESATEQT